MALARTAPPKKTVSAATAKQRMLKQLVCSDAPEQALRHRGYVRIAGVDEVGRGALYGPVVAAAVILPERMETLAAAGLKDSKQMVREDRECLDTQIRAMALAVCVVEVDAKTIDRVNIYQATRMAMLAAVRGLCVEPDHLLIDAMRLDHRCSQTKLIYGDSLSLSIAAASVVVWAGVAQGIWDAGASAGAGRVGANRAAPQVVRAGKGGGFRCRAGDGVAV